MQHQENSSGVAELPPHEEIANTVTHGLGLTLSLIGSVAIINLARSIERGVAIGCVVYAFTLIVVYAVSTLSHAVHRPKSKYLLRAWDQGVIYLLIAGTYTPFACLYVPSPARWLVLAGIWSMALAGLFSKVVLYHRVVSFKAHSYVLFGWLPALTMIHVISIACLTWMAIGGLMYTVGTLFLALDRQVSFFHATWHLFVIAGSACHYYAIIRFVVLPEIPA
jgi:hemolysin III